MIGYACVRIFVRLVKPCLGPCFAICGRDRPSIRHQHLARAIQEAACWAHARRKFYDVHEARPPALTNEALRRIGELYVIEAEIRGKPPDERQQVRQARARRLIDDLEIWLRTSPEKLSRKSDTAAAIMYDLNLWPALSRYRDDGAIEIDNSAAERALRGVAISRRNYLFAGADTGGEGAAALYSLIGTAKLNGVDPRSLVASCASPHRRSSGQPRRGVPALALRRAVGTCLKTRGFPAV